MTPSFPWEKTVKDGVTLSELLPARMQSERGPPALAYSPPGPGGGLRVVKQACRQVVTHFESRSPAISSMLQTWSETPASIAGVTRSVP